MKYVNIVEGKFLARPNRFIAHVEINGHVEIAHVKNTGRCKELLIKGVTVFLQIHNDPKRKTKYSLIAVIKDNRMINMDSQAPNKVWLEALQDNIGLPGIEKTTMIKSEASYGNSRLDFYVETANQKAYMEVKGVTLEEDGVVRFPDAPTLRGIKHIYELIKAVEDGFLAYIIFIIQMKGVKYFMPNDDTQAAFGDALRKAAQAGVHILAFDCFTTADELIIGNRVTVRL